MPDALLRRRLIDGLYTEAMVLADEARSYFDWQCRVERDALPSLARIGFSCESLRLTTRLMHVIAWLLAQRAVLAGEIAADPRGTERRLGYAPPADPALLSDLPATAQRLVEASEEIYARIARLDASDLAAVRPQPNPVTRMIATLQNAF
jgi:regulator of CtrA degradation